MLLWADAFGEYGGDEAAILDNNYGHVGNAWTLSTDLPRTGTWSLKGSPVADPPGSLNATNVIRKVFGGPKETVGVAFAYYCNALPAVEHNVFAGLVSVKLAAFVEAGGETQILLVLGTDGAIVVYRGYHFATNGGGSTLLYRSAPCVRPRSYSHIEATATISATDGAVEVRVNGVTYVNLVGINTLAAGSAEASQWVATPGGTMAGITVYLSDLAARDDQGTYFADWIGDQKAYLIMPVADTSQADWVPSVGTTGWDIVDVIPPDDTDYLELAATTGTTELELDDLPAEVVACSAIIPFMRSWKDDAGVCNVAPGLNQGGSYSTPNPQTVNTGPLYFMEPIVVDPASGLPPTPAEVNSILLVLERTA